MKSRMLSAVVLTAMAGMLLWSGCSEAPYYCGQKNTDALKAAVTRDTFVLCHADGKLVQKVLEEAPRKLPPDDAAELKKVRDFAEEHKLQQIQVTLEVLGERPRVLMAATFGKKVDEEDFTALLKKFDMKVKADDDGEFRLGDDEIAKLVGKGKALYVGDKGMVREAAEAYAKGKGQELPEAATSVLRKGDELYLVVLRNEFLEKAFKEIPREMRKMAGALPQSLGLSATLEKGIQVVVCYDDKDEAKEAGEALQAALKLAQAAELPEEVAQLLKQITVKCKGKAVSATLDASLEKPIRAVMESALGVADGKAKQIACMSNQKQLLLEMMIYSQDHDEKLPPGAEWEKELKPYVGTELPFVCPACKRHYRYFGNGKSMDDIKEASKTVLLVCDHDHKDGRVVGFADGHVELLSAARAQEVIRASVPSGLSTGGVARPAAKPGDAGFVFRIGLDPAFEPYGFKDSSGEIVGFDVDLAREVAKRRGWRIEFRPVAWDVKDTELSSGMIDCIWNGFSMNGREREYTWTEAYVAFSQVLVVRQGSGIAKASDLAGKVVAVQQGSPGAEALNAKKENAALRKSLKAVRQTLDVKAAVEMFKSGLCDAVVLEQNDAARLCQKNAGKYVILPGVLDFEACGVAFQRGDTALRDAVQATFKDMVRDGTAAKISRKWFDGRNVCIMKP